MEWCMRDPTFRRFATPEQARLMGLASIKARELQRLNSEPPLYRPIVQPFVGMIYSLNCQYEHPVEQTILLFDTDRCDSYRAIIDGHKADGRGGWHDWHAEGAKAMQQRFIGG